EVGPLLLEGGLHVRQIHYRGIHLDLAEIGIHRGIQGQALADGRTQVESGAAVEARAVVEWISRGVTQELALARRIGQQLDRARGADAVEPDQIRKARDEARAVARRVGEQRPFAATYDDPLEV